MTLSPEAQFIVGPQVPIGNSWFDLTQESMARILGQQCPAIPPQQPASPVKPARANFASDAEFQTAFSTWLNAPAIKAWLDALNSYNINLQYYDLPKSLYTVYARTGDPVFLNYARNAADSWWQHPEWVGQGAIRKFPDEASPPPRHAGIGGLILRALDGKPEYWDFCVEYTRAFLNIYMLWRLNNEKLHVDIREGAFTFHYAVWLAKVLPDSYPKQGGGTVTNGAEIRAQLHADLEKITIQYYERLQKLSPCGSCWLYDAYTGGQWYYGFTQAFTAGLLLLAFADFHQITTNATVKESLKGMILRAARHLYADGPYRLNDPVPFDPSIRWRCFWYLWHGGTPDNPTLFEKGGWSLPGNNRSEVQDGRQSIGPVVAIYGYAYKISGDPFFLQAGNELWDSAYGSTDGIHNYMNTDGKGWNQNCARAGSYLAWTSQTIPDLPTVPEPLPIEPPPIDPPPPPPDATIPVATLTSPANGASISGKVSVTATITNASEVYLIIDDSPVGAMSGSPYKFELDTTKLPEGSHSLFVRAWNAAGKLGDSVKITVTVVNTVLPPPPPPPPPITPEVRKVPWPSTETKQNSVVAAQWQERFRFKRHLTGAYVEFEKV